MGRKGEFSRLPQSLVYFISSVLLESEEEGQKYPQVIQQWPLELNLLSFFYKIDGVLLYGTRRIFASCLKAGVLGHQDDI